MFAVSFHNDLVVDLGIFDVHVYSIIGVATILFSNFWRLIENLSSVQSAEINTLRCRSSGIIRGLSLVISVGGQPLFLLRLEPLNLLLYFVIALICLIKSRSATHIAHFYLI